MKVYYKLIQELQSILYGIRVRFSAVVDMEQHDVPFVCQFAHPDHAEPSLKKELEPIDDSNWADTGATSSERYAVWAFTMCGMASFSMVLAHFKNKTEKPAVLAEDALNHNVYYEENNGTLSSMQYREFADWITQYDLQAKVISRLSVRGIQYALSHGKLAIVSVNPNIRGYDTAPARQKGGHLVLVTGYDREKKTISINNPSGFVSNDTQVNHNIPLQEFDAFYAGRGIILSNDN